jgi:hypothetical protein
LGIASIVLGLVAIGLYFVPVVGRGAFGFAFVGLGLALASLIVATKRKQQTSATTVAGLIINPVAFALTCGFVFQDVRPVDSKIRTARSDVRSIHTSAQLFLVEYPTLCPTYQQLIDGEYMHADKRLRDPWGNQYVLRCPVINEAEVFSLGPDEKEGGCDPGWGEQDGCLGEKRKPVERSIDSEVISEYLSWRDEFDRHDRRVNGQRLASLDCLVKPQGVSGFRLMEWQCVDRLLQVKEIEVLERLLRTEGLSLLTRARLEDSLEIAKMALKAANGSIAEPGYDPKTECAKLIGEELEDLGE